MFTRRSVLLVIGAVVGLPILFLVCNGIVAYARYLGDYNRRAAEAMRFTTAIARMEGGGRGCLCRDADGSFNEFQASLRGRRHVTNETLRHLEGVTGIVGFDLSETGITDAGLDHLKGLTGLVYLQLAGTDITDHGLEHLTDLTHLEAIDLADTKVTQEGAKHLEKLPKLKRVYAMGTTLEHVAGIEVDHSQPSRTWLSEKDRPEFLRGPLSARRRAAYGSHLWPPEAYGGSSEDTNDSGG